MNTTTWLAYTLIKALFISAAVIIPMWLSHRRQMRTLDKYTQELRDGTFFKR